MPGRYLYANQWNFQIISLIYWWTIFTAKQRFWVAGLQWGECSGDKQQTSKSQKTYHNTTVWRGNQSTKLAEVSNLAHQTEEAVQNSNKNKQRQGEEQEKDRTAGQEFQETWQEHQEEVFWSRHEPKFPTDVRCHYGNTWQTGRTQNLWYQPWYYGSIGQSWHLEVLAQRGSSNMNAYFVGKRDFAGVDAADETEDETEAVQDRAASAASGRRAAGLEKGNFGDGDDLTKAVPRWGTGAVAAGSETGGKDTGGTPVVDRRGGSRSTVPALINIFDRMLFNLDDNRIYGLVLADFQKAFDLVSHNILIEKLRIYGLHECSLSLIHSFLHNRRQRTVIRRSAQSSSQTLTHGVPQGSVLSPLLFLVFINDLPKGVSQPTTVDIFADDTATLSLSSPYTDTSGLCSKLCESTRELVNWSRNNRFNLNTEKTKSMFVTGTRLRTKIDGTSVDEMRIFTSKGEELDNTTSYVELMLIKTSALINMLNNYVRNWQNG